MLVELYMRIFRTVGLAGHALQRISQWDLPWMEGMGSTYLDRSFCARELQVRVERSPYPKTISLQYDVS